MELSATYRASGVTNDAVLEAAPFPGAASLGAYKVIKDLGEQGVELEIGNEALVARISFSCLVQPLAGDRVLAVRTQEGGVFVLAVLERLMPYSATLSLPSGGALVVQATDVRLVAQNEASIDARSINLRGRSFTVVSDTLTLFGRVANWVAEHMGISVKTQETVVDTLSVKALDRIAIVERTDVLHAQSVSHTIDNVSVTSAPAVVIATTEDLRLDGKRVTVG